MLIDHLYIASFQEKEIPAFIIQGNLLTGIYFMSVHNNVALSRLAEYFFQFHYGKSAAVNQVTKHLAGANGGKLVHIPHQYQPGAGCNRP